MNRLNVARCYTIVALAYGLDASTEAVDTWTMLLADVDDAAGIEATKALCRRDSPFPPRPGEIVAEAARLDGTAPPTIDVALGHYLAGNWDVHPAVRAAADRVYWDRRLVPERASFEFRQVYAAVVDDTPALTDRHHERLGPARPATGEGEPGPIGEIIRGDP